MNAGSTHQEERASTLSHLVKVKEKTKKPVEAFSPASRHLTRPQKIICPLDIAEVVYAIPGWRQKPLIEPFALLHKLRSDPERIYADSFHGPDQVDMLLQNMLGTMLITTRQEVDRLKQNQLIDLFDAKFLYPGASSSTGPIAKEVFQISKNFPFKDQPILQGFGTGFLIGLHKTATKALFATAAHVIAVINEQNIALEDIRIVSGFFLRTAHGKRLYPEIRIFRIHQTITTVPYHLNDHDATKDWAVVEIEPAEPGIEFPPPLQINTSVQCGNLAYCLGHGLGLPQKLSWDGMVYKADSYKFRCKLASYPGHSGAPVFNQRHQVIGILIGPDAVEFQPDRHQTGALPRVYPKTHLYGHQGIICCSTMALNHHLRHWEENE